MPMLAFNNDPALAEKIRVRVQAHYDADEIIKGKYWEDGKGCAVGCIIHGSNHAAFEIELGIPEEIAFLMDGMFEALPDGAAKEFPRRFINAVRPGADLSMIIPHFLLWLLSNPEDGIVTSVHDDKLKEFVDSVIELFEEWTRTGIRPLRDSGDAWDAWAAARDAWVKRSADKLIELLEETQ